MQVKVHDQYKDEHGRQVTNPMMTDVVVSKPYQGPNILLAKSQ